MRPLRLVLAALCSLPAAAAAQDATRTPTTAGAATSTASQLDSALTAETLATSTTAPAPRGPFSPWISPPAGVRCEGEAILIFARLDEIDDDTCEDLDRYLDPGKGPFDRAAEERAERLLIETGFFQHVRCGGEPGKNRLWCVLAPEQIVVDTEVSGAIPFTLLKEDLVRRFYLRSGSLLTDPKNELPAQAARIRDHLAREGFFESKVEIETSSTSGAEPSFGVDLDAQVDVGADTVLRTISVLGDPVLTEDDLDDYLRHYWFLGWIPMRFRPLALDDDIELLTQELKSRGHPEATINVRQELDLAAGATDLTLEVRAGPRLELVFLGNSILDHDDLSEVTTFAEAGAIDVVEVERTERALRTLYQREGRWKVRVRGRTETAPNDTVRVIYQIDEGPEARLRKLTFTGNTKLPTELIRDEVDLLTETKAILVPGTWVDEWVEADERAIRELYVKNGYSAASVEAEAKEIPGGLEAVFTIEEGAQRVVGEMTIAGLPATIDRTLLDERLALKKGAPYVAEELGADRREILAALAAAGYPRAEVSRKLRLPAQELGGEVTMGYTVEPGPRATFGGLILRGNFATSRSVIEEQLSLTPGEPLDLAALGEAKRRLRGLGIFGSIDLKPVGLWRDQEETWLLVVIEERNRQTLDAVVAFSTADYFSIGFDYRDRNLLGRAIALDLELRFANASELGSKDVHIGERDELQLKLRAPRPLGMPFDLEGRGYYSFENRTTYDERRVGASFTILRGVLRRTACEICPDVLVSLGYELVASELTVMIDDFEARNQDPTATIGRVIPRVLLDRRDSFVDPRTGYAVDLRFELANRFLGGPFYDKGRNFWRALASAQTYVNLGAPIERRMDDGSAIGGPVIVALAARYGVAHPYGAANDEVRPVPSAETFYYGGDLSVRGLSQGASRVAIRDANYYFVANAELRFYLLQDFGFGSIQLAGFVDLGAAEYHLDTLFTDPTISVGPALRYVTPIGPLTLAYGWPVVRNAQIVAQAPDEIPATGTLHFAFGYAF